MRVFSLAVFHCKFNRCLTSDGVEIAGNKFKYNPLSAMAWLAECLGNRPLEQKDPEVEFSKKEVLREEVEIYGQPDHCCPQGDYPLSRRLFPNRLMQTQCVEMNTPQINEHSRFAQAVKNSLLRLLSLKLPLKHSQYPFFHGLP